MELKKINNERKVVMSKSSLLFLSIILVVILVVVFNDQRASEETIPLWKQGELALRTYGDILGFQTDSTYVLSVGDWGNVNEPVYVANAFTKLHIRTKDLEREGWMLERNSIQLSQTMYSAWIIATFRRDE